MIKSMVLFDIFRGNVKPKLCLCGLDPQVSVDLHRFGAAVVLMVLEVIVSQ